MKERARRGGTPGMGAPRHGPPEMSIPEKDKDKREKIMKLIPSHDTRDTTHHSQLTTHLAQHTTHNTQHSTLNTQHTTHHAPHSDWKRPRQKILSGGAVAEKKMPPFLFFVHVCPCRTGDECFRHTGELPSSSENVRARVGRRMVDVVFG